MSVETKKEETVQSAPQNKNIKSTEYIYSDEKGNLYDGVRVHAEFEALIYPLTREEFLDLETSLKAKGCLDPIKVWKGYIVDGHHRYKICEEKNIPYDVLDMDFEDEWEVKKWMIDNQLGRRNLTDASRIEYASLRVDIIRGVAQRNQEANHFQQGNDLSKLDSKTRRYFERKAEKRKVLVSSAIGSIAGVGKRTVEKYTYVKKHVDEETLKNLQQGKLVPFGKKNKKKKLSIDGLYRELRRKEKKERTPHQSDEDQKELIQKSFTLCADLRSNLRGTDSKDEVEKPYQGLRHIGDIVKDLKPEILSVPPKELFKRIITHPIDDLHRYVDAGSIDVIITEPPCKEEDIDLFDKLGDFARHALKDGGLCVVIAGNRFLPDFIEMLHAHLDYVWLLSLDATARRYEAPSGDITKLWKPVLIFSKGETQMKTFSDIKESVENIVHTFSNAGDAVCDPFCNRGEIVKICVEQCRSLLASDMDIAKTEALKEVLL